MSASKNIAIIYASKYGFTQKCTQLLLDRLSVPVAVYNVKETLPDLDTYDTVIIGSPIHNGKFYKPMDKFVHGNVDELKLKRIGAYLTCIDEARIDEYFKMALPEQIYRRVFYKACFGGGIYFDLLHPIEKEVAMQISGLRKDDEKIFEEKINLFSTHIDSITKV